MSLEEYLKLKQIKQKDFARKLGKSQGYVSQLRHRRTTPSLKTAMKIIKLTDGAVSFHDLFNNEQSDGRESADCEER